MQKCQKTYAKYVTNFFGNETVDDSHHVIAGNKKCVELILEDIKSSFR